jgi:hypothetical protein
MAGRVLNRRELRQQADQAEQPEAAAADQADKATVVAAPRKGSTRKASTGPKVKKPRKAKTPPRQRARWGVFDGSMKQVAIFDYNQRAAADAKLADLLAHKKGTYFVQMVKEPMLEPVPAASA